MGNRFQSHIHTPVMPEEVLDYLKPSAGMTIVDATVGEGGHSLLISKKTGSSGRLICIDRDPEIIEIARNNLAQAEAEIVFVNSDYRDLPGVFVKRGFGKVDGILVDLGASSYHFDSIDRGFSFSHDAPLDMRFNRSSGITAAEIVNEWERNDLAKIFREFGEERFSGRIAGAIVAARGIHRIETTGQLRTAIASVVRSKKGKIDPATRIFQALRIAVNDELRGLREFIYDAVEMLKNGGILVIISFHSLEDRIVKNSFNFLASDCICPAESPICVCDKKPQVQIITKKPLIPSEEEICTNPRSRSAKLRVCEKV